MESLPFIEEHYKGRKTTEKCRLIAFELTSLHELAVLRYEEMNKSCGIDLTDDKTLKKYVFQNINRFLDMDSFTFGKLFDYFDMLSEKVDYKKWYFGFYHKDKYISTKAQAVYTDVYKIGD